jgi:hypothetical protein
VFDTIPSVGDALMSEMSKGSFLHAINTLVKERLHTYTLVCTIERLRSGKEIGISGITSGMASQNDNISIETQKH